ncbi:hypothetical protein [Clostridioides sp. ZZV15-6598]|uniref:hypothetical protein n=1 Tax=Clostridioides sp. ZZV15-6598 TaxID=2811501 RepID=UPI001D126A5C|nr:hypothetical protein [Clostridioides sp. ZZV15-6598]
MKVEILGTEYLVIEKFESEDALLKERAGYCDHSVKEIVIEKINSEEGSLKDLSVYKNEVVRHEIIHAFLSESGLKSCSSWATNEEMIDFFAIQFPKLVKIMNKIECLN